MVKKRSLKIAIVTPVYTSESSWGPVTVIAKIVNGLKDLGYNFSIYAGNATSPNKLADLPAQEIIRGVIVKRYKTIIRIGNYHIAPQMLLDLLRGDFDVIHAHCARSFELDLAAFVSRLRNKPLIVSAHGTLANYLGIKNISQRLIILHKIHNLLLRTSLKQAKIVTALSDLEVIQYRQLFGVAESKIIKVPNGVDVSMFLKLPSEGVFKEKYNVEDDKKIILYVGRINEIKGIGFLIKSFSYLVNEAKCDKAVLVIAGSDDGYLREAKLLAHLLKVEDKVIFTGFLSEYDKVCAYVDSKVVVHPESFNVILIAPLEAAVSGKPIILSSGNYLSKIAKKEGFGFSVQFNDVVGLARLFLKVLKENDLEKVMGKKGRKFVLDNLNWTSIIRQYEEIYQRTTRRGMTN
jgi:glycosyltransferase involved in cell wall biosynthesis